jgi:hypothetical protein
MRALLLRAALTVACLGACLHASVLSGRSRLDAQSPPPCSNAGCAGPSYCRYSVTESCQFLGPSACMTSRCAFNEA